MRQVLEKEITCPLCLDIFKEPKKLPCDHVYCKECLEGLLHSGTSGIISCPECRFHTQPPHNKVSNYPTAFRVNRLIEVLLQVNEPPHSSTENVSTMCIKHTTEKLVYFCETCKKSICRDCVDMTTDHDKHKYASFKDAAPKYRRKILSKYTQLKNEETSISAALTEVADAERSVINHAAVCQANIDLAFDCMLSILEQRRQEMKEEANKHYSSLTSIFESRKEQLQNVDNELKGASASLVKSVQDDDRVFLMKVNSTKEKIKNLLEKAQTTPLKVIEPQLLTAEVVEPDKLLHSFKTLCSLYNLANARMCRVEEEITEMYVEQHKSFTLLLNDSADLSCKGGTNRVHVEMVNERGRTTRGRVETICQGRMKISLTPLNRGRHKLTVKVNDAHITNSPFGVYVNMPPNLLSQPVKTIPGFKNPTSLAYSQGKLTLTERGRNEVVALDSSLTKHSITQLLGICDITQDRSHNLYATTPNDHRLHKLNQHGHGVKTIGNLGKKNGDFNFPNGLRVSESDELYVCDSGNHRIQVFDLDLNFKRTFGKKGCGKGQFDFPTDVDVDSNGCIYVADNGNHRIQVFAQNERHIRTLGGQKQSTRFDPVKLHVHNNNVYFTDYINHCVIVMNTTGDVIATFGREFLHEPEGITVDKDDFVYVTSHHSKIVVF